MLFRFIVAFICVLFPAILLAKGIYGSFLFSFSIPVFWQFVCLRSPFSSLGFRRESFGAAVLIGSISGIALGLLGSRILRFYGLINYSLTDADTMRMALCGIEIDFSLAKELGYRLLTKSDTPAGLLLYLLFSVFIIGLGEELFWRGFIQGKISERIGGSRAVPVTAGLFTLIHCYVFIFLPAHKAVILLGLIGVAGAIWGYMYQKTRSIWSAALSHGITAAIVWKHFFA